MALYRYVKSPPRIHRARRRIRGFSFILMSLGGGMLLWVAWPILFFSITSETVFSRIIAPVSEDSPVSPVSIAVAANAVDFTNANMWYPTSPQKHITTRVNTYTLSVPKLKIADAQVIIGGNDLNEGLVHYGGTGVPGDFGTTVVFGHSTLPQFFSPKNYKSIFSLLPTLEAGDEIHVYYDGVAYTYEVFEMVVAEPTDLSVLEQKFDDSYITLVTCVPPGTYWKRLNVKARLKMLY